MQQNEYLRADCIVLRVQEDAQLQGKIQPEAEQSDIARVIGVQANVLCDEVNVMQDRLEFSGRLNFEVLYVSVDAPDDVMVVQATSRFQHGVAAQGAQPGMYVQYTVQVEDVEEMLENPRTLSLTADVKFDAWVIETTELATVQKNDVLQVFSKQCTALETLEQQTQQITVSQQTQLAARASAVGQILTAGAFALVRDVSGTVEGSHVDGELMLTMAYFTMETEQETSVFQTANFMLPFGFDLAWQQRGMGEEAYVMVDVESVSVDAVPDEMGEYRLLDVEAHLMVRAYLWQETELHLPLDAYIPAREVKVQRCSARLRRPQEEKCTQRMLRFALTLPGGYPPMEQVIGMCSRPVVRAVVCQQDGTIAAGVLCCDVIYRTAENAVYGFHASIPFEERIPLASASQNVAVRAWCLNCTAAVLDAAQCECRVQLELCAGCMQTEDIEFVQQVQDTGPCEDQCAIVMSIVNRDDDLWSIAKRFNVSMDALLAANPQYETQALTAGDRVTLYRKITD